MYCLWAQFLCNCSLGLLLPYALSTHQLGLINFMMLVLQVCADSNFRVATCSRKKICPSNRVSCVVASNALRVSLITLLSCPIHTSGKLSKSVLKSSKLPAQFISQSPSSNQNEISLIHSQAPILEPPPTLMSWTSLDVPLIFLTQDIISYGCKG